MGMFDRWRRVRAAPGDAFEALAADMTRHGVIIITRDADAYTVYWARRHDEPIHPHATAAEVLKRSVEGRGATVLEGMRACRAKAAP